ncbi:MAG TPA: DUF3866 family protein [Armatimonadota bacterium]|nr:DUF3866 family protein [Armatimonadota bacterium]
MLKKAVGVVTRILAERPGAVELEVEIGGEKSKAIAYTNLTPVPEVGDEVILNVTAVSLSLGTGGFHFVMMNLSRPQEDLEPGPGHIMKLRYTPMQQSVLAVEEDDSPDKAEIDSFTSLDRMPVIVGQLHSQLAPATAAVKRLAKSNVRVAYVMTDSAALPIAFSRLVQQLKEAGLLDITITAGQAFGGDIETVNVHTALIAAKTVAKADVCIVCQGPGNVGTGTKYGFSGIEQGEIINAVNTLGGAAIAVSRISFADPRPRHQGISHHTLTALAEVALTPAILPLPMIDEMKLLVLEEQIKRTAITYKHRVRVFDGTPGIRECVDKGIKLSTMGRWFNDDPEFFLAASAAGAAAVELLKSNG